MMELINISKKKYNFTNDMVDEYQRFVDIGL